MKAYILIETEMGKASAAARGISELRSSDAALLSVDPVTGPFDIIAVVEAPDLETLVRAATDSIQKIDGVRRTITCVA
jgi:DNA-binding Lrp family transcriptional regulator